jgi:outer membrane protein OmpA-like peptidoglycan-associated protein/5-hydroxyisourate hydrolase-like protein (transthyretin family)
MNFRTSLLALFLLVTGASALAQGRTGDDLFDNFEFNRAIPHYESDRANLTPTQVAKLAFCYFSIHDYQKAEPLFMEVIKGKGFNAQNILLLAICQKNNLKFKEALGTLDLFAAIDSTDFDLKEIRASIHFLEKHTADKPVLEVLNMEKDNDAMAQFSPVIYGEGVLFSGEVKYDESKKRPHIHFDSGTDPADTDYGTAERPLAEIFYAEVKDGVAQQATVSAVSEKFHIGAFNFNSGDKKLYFTRTDLVRSWNADLRKHPRLFRGDLINGVLENIEKVKMDKLHNEYGSAHPAFTFDGKTMYFASDMPGGLGGSDLYMSVMKDDGNWGEPVNLGPAINTPADELFPHVYNDRYLYFASNGHPGFGHLDIFRSPLSGTQPGTPEILPIPLNSVADDFGIAIDPVNEQIGYLTSNRYGGKGDDDLYYFRKISTGTTVNGVVYDYDGKPANDALVAVYSPEGNLIGQFRTGEDGRYSIEVPEGQEAKVVATTKGFSDEQSINTGEGWDSTRDLVMNLEPSETVQGVVTDENGNPAANIQVMLYDDEGNMIYNGQTDDHGRYQFPLEQNKEYDVVARKEGFKGSAHINTNSDYSSNSDTNIQLKPIKEIFGQVKDENGKPVANALVKLLDENGKEIAQVRTDENGNYRFSDVEGNRDVILEASINGYGSREKISLDNTWDSQAAHDIILKPTDTAQGTIRDESGNPIANATVKLLDKDGKLITETRTDANGRYQVVMEENKEYALVATKDNLEGSERIVTDSNYDTQKDTDITLKPRAVIQGIVRNQDGSPAKGVTVKLYDENGNLIATTTTDENGAYRFEVDKNKNYQVVAEMPGFQGVENFFTGDNWDSSKMHDIKLQPAGKDTVGIVSDNKTKKGIQKVKVTLTDTETGVKTVTYSDGGGKFDMKLSPKKKYILELEKDGYYPKSVEIPTGGKLPEKIDLNKMYDLGMDYAGFKVKPIYYDYAKADIRNDSKEQLNMLVDVLKKNPKAIVTIRAYADCRGTDITNNKLTTRRAQAVKDYLTANGIPASQIKTIAKGKGNYVNNCYEPDSCTEDEHALNRRSEFEIDFRQ